MMHIDYKDRESPDKVPVRIHEWSKHIDSGDWMEISVLDKILDEGRNRISLNDDFKDRPIRIFFMTDDDFEITLEFWGERIETDDEFDYRQQELAMTSQAKKITELANLREKAAGHGFDLVKKTENI